MYILNEPALFPSLYLGFVDPTDHYGYKGILTPEGTIRNYTSLSELVQHVHSRRDALALPPIDNLELIIQNYLYLLGESPRSYFTEVPNSPDIPRTLVRDIEVGAKLAYQLSRSAVTGIWTAAGSGWATLTEATGRAEICSNCPKNQPTKKSKLTRFNNKLASLFTSYKKTPLDSQLHDCLVCGCPLAEKVHYSNDIVRQLTTAPADAFPKNFIGLKDKKRHACWVRKILEDK